MQISVDLQGKFLSSIFISIIIFLIIIILTVYILLKKRKKKTHEENIEVKFASIDKVKIAKEKYIKKLNGLENDLQKGLIKPRKAYQNLSMIIRYFVYEVTNIKVQNYTLEEIEKIDIPMLHELIKEYYVPEFAKESIGEINESIDKTREVILKWN